MLHNVGLPVHMGQMKVWIEVVTFLDPRFKESFVANAISVKEKLRAQLKPIQHKQPKRLQQLRFQRSLKCVAFVVKHQKCEVRLYRQCECSSNAARSSEEAFDSEVLLYKYLPESGAEAEEDPLVWWTGNEATFPMLAKLAKKYLCISATSCASERVFSTSRFICNDRRNNKFVV